MADTNAICGLGSETRRCSLTVPGKSDTQVVELPIVDMLSPRPPHLPLAIPRDLSERMIRLHGDPTVWWIGQFMKYLLRYQPETQLMLDQAKDAMAFKKPIVG